jgi:hypothetical protein
MMMAARQPYVVFAASHIEIGIAIGFGIEMVMLRVLWM